MRTTSILTLLVVAVLVCTGSVVFAEDAETPSIAPLRPQLTSELPPGTGFVPPRMDLSHLSSSRAPIQYLSAAVPAAWDWRTQSALTSVKSQGLCGSCYAFAALANIESKLLIDGEPYPDFSENNAKECNYYQTSCGGGNYYTLASWLSQTGTVLEGCDPYVASDVACQSACPYSTTLLDWRIISESSVPAEAVLKQYIYDYGPVYTSMYAGDADAWYTELSLYDGSYTLFYDGLEGTNHAVLIVGWDDSFVHAGPSSPGGWIVKNSWGLGWGDAGYFTIAYGSAGMGKWSSFVFDWQDYDTDGDLLHYDEAGWNSNIGYGTTSWGMCKFVQPATSYLYRVEFWTADVTTDIDIYVYDDFSGGTLSNLLASKLNVSFAEAGYHSVALDSPLEITIGEDFYIAVKITDATYGFPICCDSDGPYETATTYISSNGIAWLDMGTGYGDDVCIRARTSVDLPVAVADEPLQLAHQFTLSNNYPNPFNPTTTIMYSLARKAHVELSIYNLLGQKVTTLVDETMPAGNHSAIWNGADDSGNRVASGVYLYQLRAGDYVESKKMILLK
ncbi:MAG: T9SS type A sorting domain-containing protein [Candidatus Zixiibacteriota bacterium]|nr:MAG: T9SS type A sorting domain-containing protein [candidate division Zixibacteria bacterium]